jgi:hypothetical protein
MLYTERYNASSEFVRMTCSSAESTVSDFKLLFTVGTTA